MGSTKSGCYRKKKMQASMKDGIERELISSVHSTDQEVGRRVYKWREKDDIEKGTKDVVHPRDKKFGSQNWCKKVIMS